MLGNHTDYNQGLVLAMGIGFTLEVSGQKKNDGRFLFHAKDLKEFLSSFLGKAQSQLGHPIDHFLTRPA